MKRAQGLAFVCVAGLSAAAGVAGFALRSAPEPMGKIAPWAAMRIAARKVPGHALNADFELDEGHWIYGVMVVTNGSPKRIKEVEIDPVTGNVGEVEDVTPDGEAKETRENLTRALGR